MGAVKVKEINLEKGNPTVDAALKNLVNEMSTAKRTGYKAVILIHGYGSSGNGGAIKSAVKVKLREPMFSGIVRSLAGGEEWNERKREFLDACSQLRDFSKYIEGNKGVTVVLFKQ